MHKGNPESEPSHDEFLKVPEAAEELGISERSGWRLVADGEIPKHEFRGSTRIKRSDLEAYKRRCRKKTSTGRKERK
jgi:excisionase family DNA binding protein